MQLSWIHTPCLDLDYIAAKIYGSRSRIYTMRLRKKIAGVVPFEGWELEKLSGIKEDLLNAFHLPLPNKR